jgi:hypothetical protein
VQRDLGVAHRHDAAVAHLSVTPVEEAHVCPMCMFVRTAMIRRGSASMRSMSVFSWNSSRLLAG